MMKWNKCTLFYLIGLWISLTHSIDLRQYSGLAEWPVPSALPNGWTHFMGDVRALVEVESDIDAVQVQLTWRRRDPVPETINVIVVMADTEGFPEIQNTVVMDFTRESATVVFQPLYGPGEYHIYYLPYTQQGGTGLWVNVVYDPYVIDADFAWLQKYVFDGKYKNLPQAKFIRFESRTSIGKFGPMEFIALQSEVQSLIEKYPTNSYLVFPEFREHPLIMREFLPLRWIEKGPAYQFTGVARAGEYYPFQLGIYAITQNVTVESITFTALSANGVPPIPATAMNCINTGGIDFLGNPFTQTWTVPQGTVNALWCGIQLSEDVVQGRSYSGFLTINAIPPAKVQLTINISTADPVPNSGVNDIWRLSRLKWLDSTIGRNQQPTKPYTDLQLSGNVVYVMGKKAVIGNNGLIHEANVNGHEVFRSPMAVVVKDAKNSLMKWNITQPTKFSKVNAFSAKWNSTWSNAALSVSVTGEFFFDGYVNYTLSITGLQTTSVHDIQLDIPISAYCSSYMIGMKFPGGFRNGSLNWVWVVGEASNTVWLGNFDAGVRLRLKGNDPSWDAPYNTYAQIPESWGNNFTGGCNVTNDPNIIAFSGSRVIKKGQTIDFLFDVMFSPVKPLDQDHWNQRYVQVGYPGPDYHGVDEILPTGAKVINIHQGVNSWINPNINYPFRPVTTLTLANYTNWAHANGMRVKFYYTIRELSNFAKEIWPLRTLGHEVFLAGNGTNPVSNSRGSPWILEHIIDDYSACWQTVMVNGEFDAAICDNGIGRWTNYYVEGLNFAANDPVNIDGIYFDGIAFTRDTMQRVRNVVDSTRPEVEKLFDLHSINTDSAEFGFGCNAVDYMPLMPYINSLWFGEAYDYTSNYDYWLVAISGIPMGLYSEMLGPGNPYYGMVFGMSTRFCFGWTDPTPIWNFWDYFGINQSEMIGWWDPSCPVITSMEDVKATVYIRNNSVLVALGNWVPDNVTVTLDVDWDSIGMNPETSVFYAKEIDNFQSETYFNPEDEIPILEQQGWLLIIQPRNNTRVNLS